MLIKFHLKRSTLSNWILAFFFFVILIGASISEFFQAPTLTSQKLNRYRTLFQNEEFSTINKIIFKNPLGTFHLDKSADDLTPWKIELSKRTFSKHPSYKQNAKCSKRY